MTTPEQFQSFIDAVEGSHFEYKEARGNYHFDELVRYCVALANEGGGKILLGVSDRRPRQVVGTAAFSEPGRTEKQFSMPFATATIASGDLSLFVSSRAGLKSSARAASLRASRPRISWINRIPETGAWQKR